jgi:surfactin synthase thioesterase subunit
MSKSLFADINPSLIGRHDIMRHVENEAQRYVTEGLRDATAAVDQMIAWYKESGLPFELVTLAGGWKVPRPRLRLAVVLESGALAAVLPPEKSE